MAKTYTLGLFSRICMLVIALFVFTSSHALVSPSTTPGGKAENTNVNVLSKMSVEDFLSLTPKKYRELTGEKLSIPEKISLKLAQRKIKQAMKNNQPVDETLKASAIDTSDFNIGGFVLGLLLSVIGVFIAYLIGDSEVVKWAWIGFGVFLIIFLLAVLL